MLPVHIDVQEYGRPKMYQSAFLLLLAPTVVIASDPLECVDPEFVRAFLSGSSSSPVSYSTEVPEHFEVRELPSDMKLVGSRNEKYATTVILRTDQGVRHAYSRLADFLSKQGWEDITYDRSPSRRGFQWAPQSQVAEYCRDIDEKNLAVIVSERFGQTLVSLEQYDRKTLRGCLGTVRERRRTLLDRLPILSPPDGATTSNRIIGNNGHAVSTGVDVSASIGRDKLLEFFEDQIRDQSWNSVTRWSSNLSSGSVWSQDTSEQGVLIGTLHLYDAGGEPVRVQFSIDSADPEKDIDHGMSYQSSGACD